MTAPSWRLPIVEAVELARRAREAVGQVVVRTDGVSGSAFPWPRSWHNGVARLVNDLTGLSSAQPAVDNARAAAIALRRERLLREATDRYLAAHAVPRWRSAPNGG